MRKRLRTVLASGLLGTLLVIAGLAVSKATLARNERRAVEALKRLAVAEADFRANDRDGNRIQDFWTGDVAGLHDVTDPVSGRPLALIERAVADADAAPLPMHPRRHAPYAGYSFVAMTEERRLWGSELYAVHTNGVRLGGPFHNHSKFAFCAYPAAYGRTGRRTFVINEGNTVFMVDTGGVPVLKWPPPFPGQCPACFERELPGKACCRQQGDHP
jgi:hypothetical protein